MPPRAASSFVEPPSGQNADMRPAGPTNTDHKHNKGQVQFSRTSMDPLVWVLLIRVVDAAQVVNLNRCL